MKSAVKTADTSRFLILGAGAVVTEFYLPALERLHWTTGITVSDLSNHALSRITQIFPWVNTVCGGFESTLGNRNLREKHDAVVVALPNALHVPAVLAALNAA